jgi:hypothetical protein
MSNKKIKATRIVGRAWIDFDVWVYSNLNKKKLGKRAIRKAIYDSLEGCDPREIITRIDVDNIRIAEEDFLEED